MYFRTDQAKLKNIGNQIVTQCPACQARYSVTPGQLKVADGKVRCGQCLTVFDAVVKPQPKPVAIEKKAPQQKAPKQTTPEIPAPEIPAPEITANPTQKPQDHTPRLISHIQRLDLNIPEFRAIEEPPGSQGWAITGCLIALCILIAQYLWFERAHLANDPLLKPVYQLACEHIDCTLSTHQGLSSIKSTHLAVREASDIPDTLELLTGIHNTSPLAIELPVLSVQFTDSNGEIIAAKDLTSRSYYHKKGKDVIQPNERLDIGLFIQRPAEGHLGYEVDWITHLAP